MFGWTLIRKIELAELERCSVTFHKVVQCHRWFAGWQDLDIIWEYIFKDVNYGGIGRAREDYAKARKTDEYGKGIPIKPSADGGRE